jgi:predicted amidohydrolase
MLRLAVYQFGGATDKAANLETARQAIAKAAATHRSSSSSIPLLMCFPEAPPPHKSHLSKF